MTATCCFGNMLALNTDQHYLSPWSGWILLLLIGIVMIVPGIHQTLRCGDSDWVGTSDRDCKMHRNINERSFFFSSSLAGGHGITPFEVSISRNEWTQRRSLFHDNGHLAYHYPLRTHGETKNISCKTPKTQDSRGKRRAHYSTKVNECLWMW